VRNSSPENTPSLLGTIHLSAFPAAYRALFEAKLMLFADAPVYRKAFEKEFHVKFSDRLATFKDGSGSARFQDYLIEARRWITIWKASDPKPLTNV